MTEGKFIRCQGPSDILVVETTDDAWSIAGKVENPCHNHNILVRATYESELSSLRSLAGRMAEELRLFDEAMKGIEANPDARIHRVRAVLDEYVRVCGKCWEGETR